MSTVMQFLEAAFTPLVFIRAGGIMSLIFLALAVGTVWLLFV